MLFSHVGSKSKASDTATVRLYAATKLEGKTRRQRPDLQWKDEPGNRLVDAGGVLGTWVERREPPDMDSAISPSTTTEPTITPRANELEVHYSALARTSHLIAPPT